MFPTPTSVHEKLIFPKIKTIWFPFRFSDALSLDGMIQVQLGKLIAAQSPSRWLTRICFMEIKQEFLH